MMNDRHEVDERTVLVRHEDDMTEMQLLAFTAMHPQDLTGEELLFLRFRFEELKRRLT